MSVRLEREGATALLLLDNPGKLNALTGAMLDALVAACEAVDRDRSCRALIVTGVGDRAFCAGADIAEWAALEPFDFARRWVRRGHRAFDRLARLPVPTIAAINGHALGGGLELAAACDLRAMAPGATLGLPETGVGIVPGWSGTQRLARLVPPAILAEMALAGRRLTAERAAALGLVNAVSAAPLDWARAVAGEIARRGPRATEVAKAMLGAAAGEDRGAAIEALGGAAIAASDDRAEGVAAFREKRPPRFEGAEE